MCLQTWLMDVLHCGCDHSRFGGYHNCHYGEEESEASGWGGDFQYAGV